MTATFSHAFTVFVVVVTFGLNVELHDANINVLHLVNQILGHRLHHIHASSAGIVHRTAHAARVIDDKHDIGLYDLRGARRRKEDLGIIRIDRSTRCGGKCHCHH